MSIGPQSWSGLIQDALARGDGSDLVDTLRDVWLADGEQALKEALTGLPAPGLPTAESLVEIASLPRKPDRLRELASAIWDSSELMEARLGFLEQAVTAGAEDARGMLGETLLHLGGDAERALGLLRAQAQEDSPRGRYASGYLGCYLLEREGRTDAETEHHLRRGVSADDFFGVDLAMLLVKTGRAEEAVTILSSPAYASDSAAQLPLGNAYAQLGRRVEAEEAYRKGMALGDAHSAYNLALDLLDNEDRAPEALGLIEWAAERGDEKAIAHLDELKNA